MQTKTNHSTAWHGMAWHNKWRDLSVEIVMDEEWKERGGRKLDSKCSKWYNEREERRVMAVRELHGTWSIQPFMSVEDEEVCQVRELNCRGKRAYLNFTHPLPSIDSPHSLLTLPCILHFHSWFRSTVCQQGSGRWCCCCRGPYIRTYIHIYLHTYVHTIAVGTGKIPFLAPFAAKTTIWNHSSYSIPSDLRCLKWER